MRKVIGVVCPINFPETFQTFSIIVPDPHLHGGRAPFFGFSHIIRLKLPFDIIICRCPQQAGKLIGRPVNIDCRIQADIDALRGFQRSMAGGNHPIFIHRSNITINDRMRHYCTLRRSYRCPDMYGQCRFIGSRRAVPFSDQRRRFCTAGFLCGHIAQNRGIDLELLTRIANITIFHPPNINPRPKQ